jgi:hypothetical protein
VDNISDAEIAVESLLNLSGNRGNTRTSHGEESQDDASSHAPVPKLARLLRDGKGKFMYIGDSANLSFLQNIRRLVKSSIGDCSLTTDPLRHALVESMTTTNPAPYGTHSGYPELKPRLLEAKELVEQYLVATSGVLDLFDSFDIKEHLLAWSNDASKETDFTSSIYYLILAIGAQVRPGDGGENLAEAYFTRGRHLVASNFMDDPSVFTIQSYALITMYMMIICRRNGAFMNLGIAVRAAYALGLHRSDISGLFEARERRTRERVWKSLRILDIFLSASLGRPPATSEVDGGHVSWTKPSRDYEDIHIDGLSLSAMLRICFIFERILNEVYCRREVTAHLVENISQQYREWTMEFPGSLKIDGLEQGDGSPFAKMHQRIGITHLKSSYYWSIILLTRPYLVFKVSSHLKHKRKERVVDEPSLRSPTQTFADACVDSAVRCMEIVHELCQIPNIPKRLPVLVNAVFISTLVFGIACFGDFDKTFPVINGLNQAKMLLEGLARYDPLARRYLQIAEYLHQAANEYIRRRDQEQMQQRRQDVSYIFGNISTDSLPNKLDRELTAALLTPTSQQVPERHVPQKTLHNGGIHNGGISDMFDQNRPAGGQYSALFSQGPSITTSGVLAAVSQADAAQSYESTEAMGDSFPNFLSPGSSGIPSNPSYGDEFPLFSLLTDFDPIMPDPFLTSPG